MKTFQLIVILFSKNYRNKCIKNNFKIYYRLIKIMFTNNKFKSNKSNNNNNKYNNNNNNNINKYLIFK
jgi:hypothetical protein